VQAELVDDLAGDASIEAPVGIHVHHPLGPPESARCTASLSDRFGRALAAGEHAQQHGERKPRDPSTPPVLEKPRDHVARRGAEDVGEYQHAVAGVELLEQALDAQDQVVGVVVA